MIAAGRDGAGEIRRDVLHGASRGQRGPALARGTGASRREKDELCRTRAERRADPLRMSGEFGRMPGLDELEAAAERAFGSELERSPQLAGDGERRLHDLSALRERIAAGEEDGLRRGLRRLLNRPPDGEKILVLRMPAPREPGGHVVPGGKTRARPDARSPRRVQDARDVVRVRAIGLATQASRAAGESLRGGPRRRVSAQGGERDLSPGRERLARSRLRDRAREAAHLRAELAQPRRPPQVAHAGSTARAAESLANAAEAPIASQPGPGSRSDRGAMIRKPGPRAAAAQMSAGCDPHSMTPKAPPACIPTRPIAVAAPSCPRPERASHSASTSIAPAPPDGSTGSTPDAIDQPSRARIARARWSGAATEPSHDRATCAPPGEARTTARDGSTRSRQSRATASIASPNDGATKLAVDAAAAGNNRITAAAMMQSRPSPRAR